MAVYLLHSTVPLVRESGREVRHYLGWCKDSRIHERLGDHDRGHCSSRIVQAFISAGGLLLLGNYWPELTREDERRMKRAGHLQAKCLHCELEEVKRKIAELPA